MPHNHCSIYSKNRTTSMKFIIEILKKSVSRIYHVTFAQYFINRFCLLNNYIAGESFADNHIGFVVKYIASFNIADEMKLLGGFHYFISCLSYEISFPAFLAKIH